jgi:hypothetical protein
LADNENTNNEVKTVEKAESTETTVNVEEEGLMDERKLPFPRATIVNMMRKHIDKGKQIKGPVKDEMNIWLGKLVEKLSKHMNAHPYTYVDLSMFKDAVHTYEQLEEVESERERIIKYMEKIKADLEMLEREVDKKFRV